MSRSQLQAIYILWCVFFFFCGCCARSPIEIWYTVSLVVLLFFDDSNQTPVSLTIMHSNVLQQKNIYIYIYIFHKCYPSPFVLLYIIFYYYYCFFFFYYGSFFVILLLQKKRSMISFIFFMYKGKYQIRTT